METTTQTDEHRPPSAHASPVHDSASPAHSHSRNASKHSPERQANDAETASATTPAIDPLPATQPPPTGTSAIYGKKKPSRELILDLVLRSSAAVMFLIALCIMASNYSEIGSDIVHGYAFRYVDAVSAIGLAYSLYQSAAALFLFVSGRSFLPLLVSRYVTCIVDQVLAYMIISAASAGAATVMEAQDDCDMDGASSYCSQAAGSVSVLFLVFGVTAASAIFSCNNLFKQMYA